MSLIHVNQIKGVLHQQFDLHVDLTDVQARPADEIESSFLSRSLAGLVLTYVAGLSPDVAARYITDGFGDNGIDSVYYDRNEKVLYVVQTKWKHDGTGSVDLGEIHKFVGGFRDLINARFERFNARMAPLKDDINAALTDANTRISLIVAYPSTDGLAPEPMRVLTDLLMEMNDPTDVLSLRILLQADLHRIVATGVRGAPIDVDVALIDWGLIREPITSYYGQIAAQDIAQWWNSHHAQLFAPNLRMFLGATDVNEAMAGTLRANPTSFWYFNNGITVLCTSIQRKPLGGDAREVGYFTCTGISVVNGAQTVGAIASAFNTSPTEVARARVPIRLISLENCPTGFAGQVTKFTNTQNRIETRDFVALDPQQDRIKTELSIEHVDYTFKSGDSIAPDRDGFDFVEGITALACAHPDVQHAVQAKREIGMLWDDISATPYTTLITPGLSGIELWRRVQVLRAIETALKREQNTRFERPRLFAVHGNRLVAWIVFKLAPIPTTIEPDYLLRIGRLSVQVLDSLIEKGNAAYPGGYPASLFKNLSKCRTLSTQVVAALSGQPAPAGE